MPWIRYASVSLLAAVLSSAATYALCRSAAEPTLVRPLFKLPSASESHYTVMESFAVGDISLRTPLETLQWIFGPGQLVNGETGLRYRVSNGRSFGVDDLYLYFGIDTNTGEIVSSGFVLQ